MPTLTLAQAGQFSDPIEVGPGTRITATGGYVQWTTGTLTDVRNGVATWQTWPAGAVAGSEDTLRRVVMRGVATGAMTLTWDESKQDEGPEGAYWQEDVASYTRDGSGNVSLLGPDGLPFMGALLVPATSTAVSPLQASNGGVCDVTLDQNTTFAFPTPASGTVYRFRLVVRQNGVGAWNVAFPGTVAWVAGVVPQAPFAPGGFAVYEFETTDGGATWLGWAAAVPAAPKVLDRFTRTDSASTLGSAEIGGAWTAHTGTWGISSNQAYVAARTGDTVATVDAGSATVDVFARVTLAPSGTTEPTLAFRAQNDQNFLMLMLKGTGTHDVWQRVAGTYTFIASAPFPVVLGGTYSLRITAVGTSCKFYINGSQILDLTIAALSSNTRVGFRLNDTGTAARWDSLVVM